MILCSAKMPQPEEEGASDPCFLLADEGRREDAMCAMPVCNDGADQAPTPLGARVGGLAPLRVPQLCKAENISCGVPPGPQSLPLWGKGSRKGDKI